MFSDFEKSVSAKIIFGHFKFEYLWCDLAEEIFKRFSKTENIELVFK
jgi:hypothetical protein